MSEKETEQKNRKPGDTKNPVSERCLRLKKAVIAAGGNSAVSKRSGVPKPTLSAYTNGRDIRAETAVALADACGVSLDWLLRGEGEQSLSAPQVSATNADTLTLPFFPTEASAGQGVVAEDWGTAEKMTISRALLRTMFGVIPSKLLLMRVRGDSMQPTIYSHDILIVNYTPNDDLRPGIYVLAAGEMTLVKRVDLKNPTTYSIISDNKDYQSFDVPISEVCWGCADPDVQVRVIGKVIGHFHVDG